MPVFLVDKLPDDVKKMELTDDEQAAILIARWRPELEALQSGIDQVEPMTNSGELRLYPQAWSVIQDSPPDLGSASDWVNRVLDFVQREKPLRKLLELGGQHALGRYLGPSPGVGLQDFQGLVAAIGQHAASGVGASVDEAFRLADSIGLMSEGRLEQLLDEVPGRRRRADFPRQRRASTCAHDAAHFGAVIVVAAVPIDRRS